jgi:2,4-dienoyl-CoA reductase (NADPH2)
MYAIDTTATIATSVPRGAFSFVTKKLRDENIVSLPLCATNRINAPTTAETILASGSADLVSMARYVYPPILIFCCILFNLWVRLKSGRPFLADQDIVNKSRDGLDYEINTCIACNQACLDHAFVGKTASCLVNPR